LNGGLEVALRQQKPSGLLDRLRDVPVGRLTSTPRAFTAWPTFDTLFEECDESLTASAGERAKAVAARTAPTTLRRD
jgi:hypothetical protein